MGVAGDLVVARRRRCAASPPPRASISPRKPHARDPCYYSDRLLDPTRVRMAHAPFRVRMPRLRQPLRAPDPSRPAGRLPVVSGRGVAETALGLRGAVE